MDGTPTYSTRESTVDTEQQSMYLLPGQGTTDPDDPESVVGYKYALVSTPAGIKHSTSINSGSGYADTSYTQIGVINASAGLSDSVISAIVNSDNT